MDVVGEGRLLTASIPVSADDATRCEALGPVLSALLLARFPGSTVTFRGDSATVCKLLRREVVPSDIWLHNCTALTHDLLTGHLLNVEWIPREENSECDALARSAVETQAFSVDCAARYASGHKRVWE